MGSSLSKYKLDVDVRFFENDWHIVFAREILKYTRKYELECWRPEKTLKEVYVREEDGITHRLFPSSYIPLPGLKSFEYSPSLLAELKKQSQEQNALIHLHQLHNPTFLSIISAFRNGPIVAQELAYASEVLHYFPSAVGLIRMLRYIPEKIFFRHIDQFFAQGQDEENYLSGLNRQANVAIMTDGSIDFDKCKPMDKGDARKRLGLPLDKKIMLYVGRLYKLKGVHLMIRAFEKLKEKYDVEFVATCHPGDPLYKQAEAAGVHIVGYVPYDDLILYYNAADVFLMLPKPKVMAKLFFWIAAPAEALACNTPVVISAPFGVFSPGEWEKLGRIATNEEDTVRCISEIFDNPSPYRHSREIVRKYYDYKNIIQKTIAIYEDLFEKYYGKT